MVMGFLGLLVNILVNYIFIYGYFGMLEFGGIGCGVVIVVVYWVMFIVMFFYIKYVCLMCDICNEKGFGKFDSVVMKCLI